MIGEAITLEFEHTSREAPLHGMRILVRGTHSPYTVFKVHYPSEDEPHKYHKDYYVLEYELSNGDRAVAEHVQADYWWVDLGPVAERLTELEMQQRAFAEGTQG